VPTLTATVTSKGQITIPSSIRRELGLKPGSRVLFCPQENGYQIIEEKDPLGDLKGIVAYRGPAVSIEDMDRAASNELGARWQTQ
jgi:AbrB family looped-hinge helix DNA binding protein